MQKKEHVTNRDVHLFYVFVISFVCAIVQVLYFALFSIRNTTEAVTATATASQSRSIVFDVGRLCGGSGASLHSLSQRDLQMAV